VVLGSIVLWFCTGRRVLLGEVAVKSGMTELERALEAVEAFERKYGRGAFRWDRASCKELFYSGPIGGYWPEPEELRRIRDYPTVTDGAAA
jgi:hypothetical protein